MRLLLTSGGVTNQSIEAALVELLGKPVAESNAVLRDIGNCSSPTVMVVLERMVAGGRLEVGDHVVAMAFGPGLTLYMALLQVT